MVDKKNSQKKQVISVERWSKYSLKSSHIGVWIKMHFKIFFVTDEMKKMWEIAKEAYGMFHLTLLEKGFFKGCLDI